MPSPNHNHTHCRSRSARCPQCALRVFYPAPEHETLFLLQPGRRARAMCSRPRCTLRVDPKSVVACAVVRVLMWNGGVASRVHLNVPAEYHRATSSDCMPVPPSSPSTPFYIYWTGVLVLTRFLAVPLQTRPLQADSHAYKRPSRTGDIARELWSLSPVCVVGDAESRYLTIHVAPHGPLWIEH